MKKYIYWIGHDYLYVELYWPMIIAWNRHPDICIFAEGAFIYQSELSWNISDHSGFYKYMFKTKWLLNANICIAVFFVKSFRQASWMYDILNVKETRNQIAWT